MRYLSLCLLLFLISCGNKNLKTLLLHDDFEASTLTDSILKNWRIDGNVTLNKEKSFSGDYSLALTPGEGYAERAFINNTSLFPIKGKSFYGSMMLFVDQASPDGVHWIMIQASGKIKNTSTTAEVRYGGQHKQQLMANYDTQGVKTDCWQHSKFKIPQGKWTKYQWFFDAETNTMKLWVNDKLVNELTVEGTGSGCLGNDLKDQWIFPEFDTLSLGWVDYQKGGGIRKIWIDDVRIWQED